MTHGEYGSAILKVGGSSHDRILARFHYRRPALGGQVAAGHDTSERLNIPLGPVLKASHVRLVLGLGCGAFVLGTVSIAAAPVRALARRLALQYLA